MPQMAPLSWMTLMIMFILSILMINSMMYFSKEYMISKNAEKEKKKMIYWKW
uniref:ATP synthase F0 subunit 8 n=1 Tax=Ventidius pulai TaxID=2868174 RepID=UPI002E7A90B7|nr:ATP synthase F0 subunit 8 [Ventidius pulai]WQM87285.1 ATP synthase F0 subunit 8 [Ventidius pulai]